MATTMKDKPVAADVMVNIVRPAVDVFENDAGITVLADLPGVTSAGLNVHVEKDVLNIEGTTRLEQPEQLDPLYAELQAPVFQRSFTLSSELDTDRVEAGLRDGVLTVRIPKRETAKPRRIEVHSG